MPTSLVMSVAKSGAKYGYWEYTYTTLTSGTTLDGGYHVIFTNFSTEQTVNLPLAADHPGREYVIRARTGTSKCVLQRSGSDTIDDGSSETSIDINADKGRTLISDGVSRWYCTTGIGS